jgi:DNA-binding NtrC family response regulator
VAATSRNLEQMVREQEFREDLYYRLNVVNLRLPPLRERAEDIPLLVEHLLRELAEQVNRPPLSLDKDVRAFLEKYDWPGNVRQLRNALESMVVLAAGDQLTIEDLPATLHDAPSCGSDVSIPPGMSLDDIERKVIEQALAQHDGNRTHAAEALGISVRTLQRKLKAGEVHE